MSTVSYKLTYYDIRGVAEPIRWMFRLSGIDFEDERIPLENCDREKPGPQLPILCIDKKEEISGGHPVMRYLAKQFGFEGKSEMEATLADEAVEILYDLRLCAAAQTNLNKPFRKPAGIHTVFRNLYNEKDLSKKVLIKTPLVGKHFPVYLGKLNALLKKSGGPYLAGSSMTYADLAFANFIDICEEAVNPDLLKDYPDLGKLKENIFGIAAIQDWIEFSGVKSLDCDLPIGA